MPDGEAIEAGIVTRSHRERAAQGRGAQLRHPQAAARVRRRRQRPAQGHLPAAQRHPRGRQPGRRRSPACARSAMTDVVRTYVPAESVEEQWDLRRPREDAARGVAARRAAEGRGREERRDHRRRHRREGRRRPPTRRSQAKLDRVGVEQFTPFMRMILLQSIDQHWREHLAALDYLRQGIHLRGYAQKNPKQEYKREAFELFAQLLDVVKMDVTRILMTVRIQSQEEVARAAEAIEERAEHISNVTYTHPNEDGSVSRRARRRHAPQRWRRRCRRSAATTRARAAAARSTSTATASSPDRHARQPVAAEPADLHPVPGVRIGIAMAGMRKANRRDLTVVRARRGLAVAGVFTNNRFCAAPVQLCREHLAARRRHPRAAHQHRQRQRRHRRRRPGCARARPALALAERLGIAPEQVLPFSTGVIMETLPSERIEAGLPAALADLRDDQLGERGRGHHDDRHACRRRRRGSSTIGGKTVTVTGISQGRRHDPAEHGDDARLRRHRRGDRARRCCRRWCARPPTRSFNRITIDGDTSTNDSFVLIATGSAGHAPHRPARHRPKAAQLREAVIAVAQPPRAGDRARRRRRDQVHHRARSTAGATKDECRQVAYAIAHSPLVKTAFFASDPNLGPHPRGGRLRRHRRSRPEHDRPLPRRRARRRRTAAGIRTTARKTASA